MRMLTLLLTLCIAVPLAAESERVDYFKKLEEQTYPPELATDDNGFRMFIRQFGTAGYDTGSLWQPLSPEDIEFYRRQTYEKLGLDPDMTPTLTLPREPHRIVSDFYTAKGETYDYSHRDGNVYAPWTLEQFPMLADWVNEIDEPLDALAEMIRKPVFRAPFLQRPEWLEPDAYRNLIGIHLPECRLYREIALLFHARAMYRVGQGDLDGAIDDKLTIYRLGRQSASSGLIVPYLVSIAIEGVAKAVHVDANPVHPLTKEQIRRMLADLDALPPRTPLSVAYEGDRLCLLSVVQDMAVAHTRGGRESAQVFSDFGGPPLFFAPLFTSIDWDVVYRRVNEIYDAAVEPQPRERFSALLEAVAKPAEGEYVARFFMTRDGLEMLIADRIIALFFNGVHVAFEGVVERSVCAENMHRLVLALKLYQLDHGGLPTGKNWPMDIKQYLCDASLGEPSERYYSYFSCPSNPSPKGMTTYALVEYDGNVPPEHYETILLVELVEPVPFDRAVLTVDEVLALWRRYWRDRRESPPPHPGGMNVARQSGSVLFLQYTIDERELSRLLGRDE